MEYRDKEPLWHFEQICMMFWSLSKSKKSAVNDPYLQEESRFRINFIAKRNTLLLLFCFLQGVPSQMIFKESIYLSFCAEYLYSKNCSEKVFYCSFCMQKTRSSKWLVLLLQKSTLYAWFQWKYYFFQIYEYKNLIRLQSFA